MGRARELIDEAVAKQNQAMELLEEAKELYAEAKALTYRASPIRRAPVERVYIDDDIRAEVIDLAKRKKMTMHDIARKVGLRNGGRVSEILNDKR
jgi:hypothetical protein